MVVEIDSAGPGDESWRSTRFTAKINTTESFVYGHTEIVDMDTIVWNKDDSVEHSWIKYGADEEVTLVVSRSDGIAISSATVYPKNAKFTKRVSYGSLYLTIRPNTNLYVEINGDRKNTLTIIGQRPKPELSTTYTDWTTRELSVTNVDTTLNLLTVPNHGIPSGGFARVAVNSSGTMPAASQGLFEANHELVAAHVSDSLLAIVDREATQVLFSSTGTGDITLSLMDFMTGGTLYFPAGIHHIGRGFRVESNTTLYLDVGAIVVGSLDLRRHLNGTNTIIHTLEGITQDVSLEGPGILSGTYARRADLIASGGQAYSYLVQYVAIEGYVWYGTENARAPTTNRVYGTTIFKSPFYVNRNGIGEFNQCSIICPWTYNADGFRLSPRAVGVAGQLKDSYALTGDDSSFLMNLSSGPLYATRCFLVTMANSSVQLGYWPAPRNQQGYSALMDDMDILYLAKADSGEEQNATGTSANPCLGSRSIIKALTDGHDGTGPGEVDQALEGPENYTISNVRIWDTACQGRPITLGNLRYPFGGSVNIPSQRDQHGSTAFWRFENFWIEGTPDNKSLLHAEDAVSTPHDVVVTNMTVGGVRVTTNNIDTFWDVDPNVYNITFDTPQVTDPYSGGQ